MRENLLNLDDLSMCIYNLSFFIIYLLIRAFIYSCVYHHYFPFLILRRFYVRRGSVRSCNGYKLANLLQTSYAFHPPSPPPLSSSSSSLSPPTPSPTSSSSLTSCYHFIASPTFSSSSFHPPPGPCCCHDPYYHLSSSFSSFFIFLS